MKFVSQIWSEIIPSELSEFSQILVKQSTFVIISITFKKLPTSNFLNISQF
jgi:hypothetical protein